MIFPLPVSCSACGSVSIAQTNPADRNPRHTCPDCDAINHIMEPLSISIVADKLLIRAELEIGKGDFTIAIILSAMAVETAVTQVFMKWKRIDYYFKQGSWNPPEAEDEAWEQEYKDETMKRQKGLSGFEKEAKFIGTYLVGRSFDEFATAKGAGSLNAKAIHVDLFDKRNRVMHWGEVTFGKEVAEKAYAAAVQAVRTLKQMDQEKYEAEDKARRESPDVAG